MEEAMKGCLIQNSKKKVIGEAISVKPSKISKVGTIVGFMVTSGKVTNDSKSPCYS